MNGGEWKGLEAWRGRKVFVTGASGFLGRWLTRRLAGAGAVTFCLVRDGRDAPPDDEHRRTVRGDVRDLELMTRTLALWRPEVLFHLAGSAIIGAANADPVAGFETNIAGSWTVLEASRRAGSLEALVMASSYQVMEATDPYGTGKRCAELLGYSYARTFGLPVAMLRSCNIFGGDDPNTGRIVPGTIRAVLKGERPVIRSDGKGERDYLYVEDWVEALLVLADKLSTTELRAELRGEAFRLSGHQPLTVLELVERILARMDSDLTPDVRNEFADKTPGERAGHGLRALAARAALNWHPRFPLDEGLDRTIAWYRTAWHQPS